MAKDILLEAKLLRADISRKLDKLHEEMELFKAPVEPEQTKERVFVIFPLLPPEVQLKVWKEATAQEGTNLGLVTEVIFCPATKAHPNGRFVSPKQRSSLLYACTNSRNVVLKEMCTLAPLHKSDALRNPYIPVYYLRTDIIYLHIKTEENSLHSYTTSQLIPHEIMLNVLDQGITNLALNFDIWSCNALILENKIFKKLKNLFLVVSAPPDLRKGRHLCMYEGGHPNRHVTAYEDMMVPRFQEILQELKMQDPTWVPPAMRLVSVSDLPPDPMRLRAGRME